MKIITLQRAAVCADCGAELPVGTRARYYSADKIYCESHDEPTSKKPAAKTETEPLFSDEGSAIEDLIQFLEEVQASLGNLMGRLRDRRQ